MKTIQLVSPGRFRLLDEPAPRPNAGEALVRVHCIGLCGTDIHAYRGNQPFFQYPRVLGHELGVEILEIGDNSLGLSAGDRCSVEPYMNEATSPASKRGKTNCCENLNVIGVHSDGGIRQLITVPVHKLHKANALSYEQLAVIETLCIGAHAVERSVLKSDECALIIGAGPIGLGAAQ